MQEARWDHTYFMDVNTGALGFSLELAGVHHVHNLPCCKQWPVFRTGLPCPRAMFFNSVTCHSFIVNHPSKKPFSL